MLKKELEANKEAYFDMRDREKSFKQKIKEERRELKQDREKLTKLLIEKQKQIKDDYFCCRLHSEKIARMRFRRHKR